MTYQPRPGDIGLTQISGVGGKAIRLAQYLAGDGFKDYEHAFVVVKGPLDPWIVEAMPGGAQHVINWHDPERTIYLRCPDEYRDAVAAAALALVGTPYSWADYAAIAAHRLHVPAPHLERYIEASGHLMCAQLADRAADRGGWHLFDDHRWVGDITPGDLTELADQQMG